MATFIRLTDYKSSEEKRQAFNDPTNRYEVNPDDFKKIPGSPIAYWVSENILKIYENEQTLGTVADARKGLVTGNDDLYLKLWYEVSYENSFLSNSECGIKWRPLNKGGYFRKWYGNNDYVVNWGDDGYDLSQHKWPDGRQRSSLRNSRYFFREGITWTYITSGGNSFRYYPEGFTFAGVGPGLFIESNEISNLLAYTNSIVFDKFINLIGSSTISLESGEVEKAPIKTDYLHREEISLHTESLINMTQTDWDSFETSWDFEVLPILNYEHKGETLKASYINWREFGKAQTSEMKRLEEENNKIFIDAYGLQDELTPDVPIDQITLTVNPAYRYGKDKTDKEYEELFRTDSMKELISYSIGCMMGRYSLDEKGLIYAHSGNEDFDHSKYPTFPADEDGIIPLTDLEWFPDDVTNRFIEFIEKVWGKDAKNQNLKFVADSLSPKRGETPEQTIRRYMSANFFKDHMKRYKKRPIYWLFSSGKEKAFEALVYLHRYSESTLSRMRSEYVNPLQTNMNASLARLDKSLEDSSLSSSEQKKLEKEREVLIKKITELRTFDEQLKHYADQRISIDLDDGVKVNYGKFGSLLAEVKNITGGKDDE